MHPPTTPGEPLDHDTEQPTPVHISVGPPVLTINQSVTFMVTELNVGIERRPASSRWEVLAQAGDVEVQQRSWRHWTPDDAPPETTTRG